MRNFIRNVFGLTKSEANGFLVLLPICILLLVAPDIYNEYGGINYDNYKSDKALLDSLFKELEKLNRKEGLKSKEEDRSLFNFNPNTIDSLALDSLLFPEFLKNRLKNYRSKGGRFSSAEDFKKLYGVTDSLFLIVKPYIKIPKTKTKKLNRAENAKVKSESLAPLRDIEIPKSVVRINSADTLEFRKLRGIGPAYARRIAKYRSLLGGYYSLDQIREVYGVSDSLYSTIKENIALDSIQVRQIKINLATFKELNGHPYITYEQTKDILNSKSRNGKFRNVDDLYILDSFDSMEVVRLIPYIDFR